MTTNVQRIVLTDFALANMLYADARVSVLTVNTDTWATTATPAALYKSPTGTAEHGNPIRLDSYGRWPSPVYVDAAVVMRITGAAVPAHDTAIGGLQPVYSGPFATLAHAGSASALPALPAGYVEIDVGGTGYLFPVYSKT